MSRMPHNSPHHGTPPERNSRQMSRRQQRNKLLRQRADMRDHAARSLSLQRVLRTWLLGQSQACIGAYWPIRQEFDPLPSLYRWQEETDSPQTTIARKPLQPIQFVDSEPQMLENLLAPQRSIGLPDIDPQSKTLRFLSWYPGCPMKHGAYDIPVPDGTQPVTPSILLVPCVGFGAGGFRLGYGGGYYDRTLAHMQPRPYTVGLAFACASVPEFLPAAHDIALDCILTDQGQVWP